ncbi:MAG: hypothetical protein WA874_17860 [Chryseosolibacter sp.]
MAKVSKTGSLSKCGQDQAKENQIIVAIKATSQISIAILSRFNILLKARLCSSLKLSGKVVYRLPITD